MNLETIVGVIIGVVLAILLISLVALLIVKGIRIIPQSNFYVIERLGKYSRTLNNGIRFLVPFIDKVQKKGNYKEKVKDFAPQEIITKDNAIVQVDTVIFLQITDPKLYAYGAEDPIKAIENLSATTLRNLLGELELDETLTSRDTINTKLADILDSASDSWGIKIHRFELKNILPPKEIQSAMEKQMRAEREKRANILEAEGFKVSAILEAEGKKEVAVLNAEATKKAFVLEAEGQKQAIELLNSSKISKEILTLKAIEQFGKLSDGKATKIIVPPNLTSIVGAMTTFGEVFNESKTGDKKQQRNKI